MAAALTHCYVTLLRPHTTLYMYTADQESSAVHTEAILRGRADIMVQYIETLDEFKAIIESGEDKFIVIDFTASWCGPCQSIAPFFESLISKYPSALFYKVDVDEAADIAQECGIRAMPTFLFYKGGKKVDDLSGADEEKLECLIKKWSTC